MVVLATVPAPCTPSAAPALRVRVAGLTVSVRELVTFQIWFAYSKRVMFKFVMTRSAAATLISMPMNPLVNVLAPPMATVPPGFKMEIP